MPRRCRQCKQHNIHKDVSPSEFTCSPKCWQDYRDAQYAKKREPKAKVTKLKPKKKAKSIAKLVEAAAVLLQKLVRMKAADENGYCNCVTCTNRELWQRLQGGHFIERGRLATKLLEENVHPQCLGCNAFHMKTASGVLDYRAYMVSMYGEKFVEELIQQSKQVKKYTRAEVEEITADFEARIKEQESRLSGRAITHEDVAA